MKINTLAIIPHYRHIATLPSVIAALRRYDLNVLVVDDGSGETYRDALRHLEEERVRILFLPRNRGKGGAVKEGLQAAFRQGYSHALQIDADAQHCFDDISKLLQASAMQPEAVVCGRPVYGGDAPKSRLYGRKITNFWNAVHTWSRDIKDGMCGFRIYPLAATVDVLNCEQMGERMSFDNEILVRLHWRKLPFVWIDTPVSYQTDGLSHFRAWEDNLLISKMHTRLFFGMLARRLRWWKP